MTALSNFRVDKLILPKVVSEKNIVIFSEFCVHFIIGLAAELYCFPLLTAWVRSAQ